jgi:hypothetical protein
VAVSNVEQHSWLGYYILPPPDLRSKKDTESGEMEAASEETIELKVSRTVGLGVHEDIDFTNFTQQTTHFTSKSSWTAISPTRPKPSNGNNGEN